MSVCKVKNNQKKYLHQRALLFIRLTNDSQRLPMKRLHRHQIHQFLLHALCFPHHRPQILLYHPPVQLGGAELLAQHTNMSKASLYLFLIVTTLWLPIFFHQDGSKVLMRSCILSHKAFHLLARYFREYFIYLVYLSVCVRCYLF